MKRSLRSLLIPVLFLLLCILFSGIAGAEPAPVLKTQPGDRSVPCNTVFALNVSAEGENLSYLWQYRDSESADWTDWKTTSVGYLYAFALPEMDQRQYRCVVSNDGGSVISQAFSLKVLPDIMNVWQYFPGGKQSLSKNSYAWIRVHSGDPVRIETIGYGNGLTWQWYLSRNYGADWVPMEGKTDRELLYTAKDTDDGMFLDCVATDVHGNTVSLMDQGRKIMINIIPDPVSDGEITLWFLNDWAREYLSLPADYMQEYDLGGKTAQVVTGDTAKEADGKIRPAGIQTLALGSGDYSASYDEGDTILKLSDGSMLTVHTRDYAKAYAEGVMDDYLKNHITPGMTEYEKAVQCCRFSASYEYDVAQSSSISMVITGGADCWGHADAVLSLLKKLGISSAYHDLREGRFAGHLNVMAKLDGAYYELETSYEGTNPESYSITYSQTPFLIRKLEDGTAAINTYLDPEGPADLVIPETIEGLKVTAIDRFAFQTRMELHSVTVPESVTSIGEKAFVNCRNLVSAQLPASLRDLGSVVFGGCDELERIEVAKDNPVFASKDGLLLGKGGTQLLFVPNHCGKNFVMPEGVVSIANSACQNMVFDTFVIPGTVREIGEVVFWGTRINRLVLEEGITEIPLGAFANLEASQVLLPQSLKTIGDNAFAESYISCINLPEGLETIGENAFGNCNVGEHLMIPSTVKSIGSRAFKLLKPADQGPDQLRVLFDRNAAPTFGENVFSGAQLGVWSGSSAHAYAKENGIPYILLDHEGRTLLQQDWFKLKEEVLSYNGNPLTPEISLTDSNPQLLSENDDYLVAYENNDFPGTGTAVVTGIGVWSGSFRYEFKITYNKGFLTDREGNTYYFDGDGNKATGERWIQGRTYHFDDNGILCRIPGDVNNDTVVDGRDAIRLMKYLAGEIDEETGEVFAIKANNADLNEDGIVDELDLLRLMKHLGGEIYMLE